MVVDNKKAKKLTRKELKRLQKKAEYEREVLSMGGSIDGKEESTNDTEKQGKKRLPGM